jgi:hypothetical protein
VQWAVDDNLTLSASATFLDTELKTYSCQFENPESESDCSEPEGNFTLAPAGTRLPVSPEFKMNAIARYAFKAGSYDAFAQAAVVYQSDAIPTLDVADAAIIGTQPSYTTGDLAFGVGRSNWTAELFVENVTDELGEVTRYARCATDKCPVPFVVTIRPLTFGLKFGQRF